MKFEKVKIIIVLTVLVDVIGLGIIIPVLPFYVESFGVSSFVVTLLFSVFAFFSFISSPFLGALSDRIGRRPVLIASIVSTALGWFVFASANAVWVLFLGRVIDGIAAGNFPIAQSYLLDIAKNDKERTTNLGLIGAVFGIGFMVGPVIGATLGGISPALPFWFVGFLAMFNAIGAYFFLPETNHNKDTVKKIIINPFVPLFGAMKDDALRSRYLAWFLFGIAFAGMQSIFALFAMKVFGFSATTTGYLFTAMGVILVVNQGFALKRIWLKYFKEVDLEIWFFVVMILGFIFLDLKIFTLFVFGLFLTTVGQSTLRVVMSSGIASVAGAQKRGEVMGIMASIMSVSMIIGPLVAGALFVRNVQWPFLLNILLLLTAFFIMKKCCINEKIVTQENVEVIA
ncbi:MAG: Major facilitator superfamily [Candidatus Moranbacteria bacterium GW2011_GWE1_36_7]|nr:MAG: Major facilitator superfamily [Candidatus Moranbacteria bacterium GW2011_GWD2_36_12]KKQ06610.1 MAG: Major facilitator superfamily [Candidatus Moranbacteria bacterium GW2011_GWE2_36_40]KKQ15555.1 MAG: Major facilitator superfamily [Candidatus Moranbacteria bacterium GW2011_GWE1_36_7]